MADRPRAWADTILNVSVVGDAAIAPVNLLASLTASDTITAVRLVGDILIVPENADTNESVRNLLTMGIGVTSLEAFNASVLPDARTEADFPPRGWLYRDAKPYLFSNSATFGIELAELPRFKFDLRAARRVDKGVLFLEAFNDALMGTGSVRLMGIIRALCLT